MRKPTPADAELLLRLYELRREPELRRARRWFMSEFQPGSWEEILPRWLSHSDEDRWLRMTVAYWELVATLVNRGLVHAELFFDHTGEDIAAWQRCVPWIAGARAHVRPTYLSQFERMVTDHQKYRARADAAFLAAQRNPRSAAATSPAGRRAAARRASGRRPGRGSRGRARAR